MAEKHVQAQVEAYEGREATVRYVLEPYDTVVFNLPDGKVAVMLRQGQLEIRAINGSLIVQPQSGNVITARSAPTFARTPKAEGR
jgi:hypothetical protein